MIGVGHAGMSVLGRLGTRDFRLRAHDIDPAKVAGLQALGGLNVEGAPKTFAPVELVTTDLAAAVKGAAVIVVCTYGTAHAEVARQLAPFLEPQQIVVLLQGNFGGALLFRSVLDRNGAAGRGDIAEMDASPFGAKVLGTDRVLLTGKKERWQLAAMPASRTQPILDRIAAAFPGMVAAANLLHTGFSDLGGIFHVGGIITNVGRVESDEAYHFYGSNMTPSVCNLLERLDGERVAVAHAYGIDLPDAKSWLAATYDLPGDTLQGMLHAMVERGYRYAPAPKSLAHRYLSQDAPCVLVPISAFGKAADVATPVTDAAIQIASALTGRDFMKEGRTLEALGLQGKSVEGIAAHVSQ